MQNDPNDTKKEPDIEKKEEIFGGIVFFSYLCTLKV